MTTTHTKPIDELVSQARGIARALGTIPSQNKLKSALHVRSERARTVLNALRESGFDPTEPTTEPMPMAPGRLSTNEGSTGPGNGEAERIALSGTIPDDLFEHGGGLVPNEPDQSVSADLGQAGQSTENASAVGVGGPARRLPGIRGTVFREPVPSAGTTGRRSRTWPIVLLAAPAMVAIWSGWVGLGALTGFGMVHPLPGIADGFTLNSAITLPVGVETYAAYALRVWLATGTGADQRARAFAKWSAIGSLALGAAGQVAYHLMTAEHVITAPWEITTAVACLPVIVLGFGAALAHLKYHPQAEHTNAGGEER
jgi:hypothetical protein